VVSTEKAFQGMALLNPAAEGVGGLVDIKDATVVDWGIGTKGVDAEEPPEVLVSRGCQGFPRATDKFGVLEDYPDRGVSGYTLRGPDT